MNWLGKLVANISNGQLILGMVIEYNRKEFIWPYKVEWYFENREEAWYTLEQLLKMREKYDCYINDNQNKHR